MKKTLISMIILASLISCDGSKNKRVPAPAIETIDEVLRLNNPSVFMGSNFGEFLQFCHKTSDYERMLKFSSSETRTKFGDNTLLHFFRVMQFSYPLELKAKNEDKGQITLIYQTTINATIKTIQMVVIVERDSCKLVLERLDIDNPFIGL